MDLTSSIFNFISGIHTCMLYKHVATSLKVVRWVALMEYILFIVVHYVCKHILFLDNQSCPRMAEAKRKILIELFSKAVYTSYFFLHVEYLVLTLGIFASKGIRSTPYKIQISQCTDTGSNYLSIWKYRYDNTP